MNAVGLQQLLESRRLGCATTEATIENLQDLWDVERGWLAEERVRRVIVSDALVDSAVTLLSLPTKLIQQLGLSKMYDCGVASSVGRLETTIYQAVRLTIQGRDCTIDVMEVPDGAPVLIGRLPLLQMDFVVDPRSRNLIGNPAHGGEQMFELYLNPFFWIAEIEKEGSAGPLLAKNLPPDPICVHLRHLRLLHLAFSLADAGKQPQIAQMNAD